MNQHRWLTQACLAIVTGVCLIGFAGCSTSASTDSESSQLSQNAVVSKDTPERRSAIEAAETRAKQFAACLTESGIETNIYDDNDVYIVSGRQYAPKTAVVVRMLDSAGTPMSWSDDAVAEQVANSLYSDSNMTPIGEDGRVWVFFRDSTQLMGTPYAGKQAAYQACERKNPEFEQADLDAIGVTEYPEEAWQASLEYARDCRAKGFSWVKDPVRGEGDKPGEGPGIQIPNGISDEELRRWLKECPTADLPPWSAEMLYADRGNNYSEILRQYELEHQ
ncbi:hypothetical protein [Bifidobacterium leontopitheci]|uniref:Uridine kinase n=1 Tax=Bifidobacterium leontopitheci TaxID=2650774 RepID=A0A6I1GK82_9BIFI|nr:hypothetical protein [Bifidobacterium leontopitheci]KAB7789777.1 Uridine kinase [Bifidobacterium leontopitheci]